MGLSAGTPFSLDHRFSQTGWLRPANASATVPGPSSPGMGTVPGVGVPMVLISGRLAAERVLARPAGDDEAGQGDRRWTHRPPASPPSRGPVQAYERCRQLHARHGRTYYLATLLLPAGSAATSMPCTGSPATPTRSSTTSPRPWTGRPGGGPARLGRPVLRRPSRRPGPGPGAAGRPPHRPGLQLDVADFEKFLDSMAMDLTVDGYRTYDDLLGYMEGSAAVIGTMMAPILESADPPAAREHARQLGLAFQLTNFIRTWPRT